MFWFFNKTVLVFCYERSFTNLDVLLQSAMSR